MNSSRRLDLELDVLVLRGANDCLPAHVVSAEKMATRLHNELRVGLYQDVISDLAVFSKQLDRGSPTPRVPGRTHALP